MSTEAEPRPGVRALKIQQVCDKTGWGRRTIWRKVSTGEFPAPFHLNRSARWLEADVDKWILQQAGRAA